MQKKLRKQKDCFICGKRVGLINELNHHNTCDPHKEDMNRWSTQITQGVNDCMRKGRQPMGKGSRRTTYTKHVSKTEELIVSFDGTLVKGLKATVVETRTHGHAYV